MRPHLILTPEAVLGAPPSQHATEPREGEQQLDVPAASRPERVRVPYRAEGLHARHGTDAQLRAVEQGVGLGRSNVGGNRGQALDRRERHRPVHGHDDARGIGIHGIQQVVGQAQQTGEGLVELRIAQGLGPHELVPQPFALRRGRIVDRGLGPGSTMRRDLFRHYARL